MAVLLGAAPAFAGDRAQTDFIGYSDDGRYFAFEQYGILDGSGGYYSDIFVTDLVKDKWMDGVPFSAKADGEDPAQNLAETRATARKAAVPLLKKLGIQNPVSIAALRGDGELDGDDKAMRFGHPFYSGIEDDFTMRLEVSDAPESPACADLQDGPFKILSLKLTDANGERLLHEDKTLPKSRGCPLDYSIYGVVYPLESEGGPVALISVYTRGFEGPDRRFIALPMGQ